MTLDPEFYAYNIRYSAFHWIETNFITPYAGTPDFYTVNFGDPFWDSDVRGEEGLPLQRWVETTPLRETAGMRGGFFLLQLDAYERLGTREGKFFQGGLVPTADQGGLVATAVHAKMVQRLVNCFVVKCIPLLDFMTDPTDPQDTGYCMMTRSSAGKHRALEEVTPVPWDGGPLLRTVITVRLNLPVDLAINESFDDAI